MASMRDIKRRKESIQSTEQITRAMKLVSTVKLQKARAKAENSKYYFDLLYKTMTSVLALSEGVDHPYLTKKENADTAVIVITSNRGLAGGYNSNVVKLITEGGYDKKHTRIYAIGKKGVELLATKGYNIVSDDSDVINEPLFKDAIAITDEILKDYKEGKIGEIRLAYTFFKNTVSHTPRDLKLLPVDPNEILEDDKNNQAVMDFDAGDEETIDAIIPMYISGLLYVAMLESLASENGARMQAMDNATTNADEMIEELALEFNRARQGAITQELTEIIAGANAV